MKRLLVFLCLTLAAFGWSVSTQSGAYQVQVVTDPAVPTIGKATLKITITSSGKPVTGARVRALAQMPGMPMGEKEASATPSGTPGVYTVPAAFAMEGGYDVTVTIDGPQGHAVAVTPIKTGQSTTCSNIDWLLVGPLAFAVALAVLAALVTRRRGQRVDLKRIFTRSAVMSVAMLVGAIALAAYAVNHFRRPGAMTPLQAQGMEMSTPAPAGVTPVVLTTARVTSFAPSVRYSGQAAGYVEQDVFPRVTGTLLWMPFYVGDHVEKGELLARLDTSQLDPLVAQNAAAVQSANEAVNVARSDYAAAQAGVDEADAMLSQYTGAVDEAKANLESARQDRLAANADLSAAEAQMANAQAGEVSAKADADYASKQADRQEKLYGQGAISLDQAQRARSDAEKSVAGVVQAQQMVSAAQAVVAAARANIAKADSQIAAAKQRVQEAESELMTHHAHVRTAKAGVASSAQKISQMEAQANQAQAQLSGAAAQQSYAQVRSEIDGVVTDRLITPGTLVNPGQAIIRIAQISPIRLQANVAESDLANVQVGDEVRVWHRDANEAPVIARVTSVSPSLDPMARTGIVEATASNKDGRFLPGQFLTMEISLGHAGQILVVPIAAVHQLATIDSSTDENFVWVASPDGEGGLVAHKKTVVLGSQSGEDAAVLHGLTPGDRVVVQGGDDLTDGQAVSAQASGDFATEVTAG